MAVDVEHAGDQGGAVAGEEVAKAASWRGEYVGWPRMDDDLIELISGIRARPWKRRSLHSEILIGVPFEVAEYRDSRPGRPWHF